MAGWLLCWGVWVAYLLAFWPGFMTEDSVDQWSQAQSGTFRNEHPVVYALIMRLLTRAWNTPAAVAVLQIALVSSAVVITARELLRWGAPRCVVALTIGVLALSPVTGLMTITLWKDIPYSAMLLVLFAATMRLVATGGRWAAGAVGSLTLTFALFMLASLRHNGQFVAVLFLGALALVWRSSWRRFALVGMVTAALTLLVRWPLFAALEVPPINPYFLLANQTHQLAAILHEGAALTPAERSIVTGVMPVSEWENTYNCCSVMPTFARGNQAFVTKHFDEYVKTIVSLGRRHPAAVLRRQACVSSCVWYPREASGCPSFTFYPGIVQNDVGLKTEPKAPVLQASLLQLGQRSQQPGTKEVFWRPATYLYLHVACVLGAAIRLRRVDVTALALAGSANALVLLALSTVQDFRFHYGLYLIAMFSPALLFVGAGRQTSPN